MMKAFTTVLSMNLSASIVIFIVLLIRAFLKRVPRVFSYFLWMVVFLRLLMPFSPEVKWGIIPNVSLPDAGVDSDFGVMGNTDQQIEGLQLGHVISEEETKTMESPRMEGVAKEFSLKKTGNRMPDMDRLLSGASIVWLTGCCGLLLYSIYGYSLLAKRLKDCEGQKESREESKRESIPGGNCRVILSKKIPEPFVAGMIRPTIYLPEGLDRNQQELVILHEKMHVRRRDHLIKPLAYLAVCIHWFNPLVWLAFHSMECDMEISCDEAVLKKAGYENKKMYADTLLYLSEGQEKKKNCAIAFGEKSVKTRIEKVVGMKETKTWITVIAAVGVFAAAVLLLVNGKWNLTAAQENNATDRMADMQADTAGITGTDSNMEVEYIYEDNLSNETAWEEEKVYLPTEKITVTDVPTDAAGVTDHRYYVEEPQDDYAVLLRQAEDAYKEQAVQYICPTDFTHISNAYGFRVHPVTQERILHSGVDFAAETGTPVNAAEKGIVIVTGQDPACGNYAIIQHENGDMTYYANCDEILAQEGQKVEQGEQIATVGNTGKSTGSHLHFALSRNGSYIEPVWQ